MENFYQIFTLLANSESISLNTNILEVGVFNLLGLYLFVFLVFQEIVVPSLEERKSIIKNKYESARDQANIRAKAFIKEFKGQGQYYLIIDNIIQEGVSLRQELIKSSTKELINDLKKKSERGFVGICMMERKVVSEITELIILKVVQQTVSKFTQAFSLKNRTRSIALINDTINKIEKIEGDL